MKPILVTGSSGHLGEALMRRLKALGKPVLGLDIKPSPWTDLVASIIDQDAVLAAMDGVGSVLHAATLHKPHVATHTKQDFVETNITGTLNLLEAARLGGVSNFVMTSTTSVFGDALVPPLGEPAAWINETVRPVPKNIYGVTKCAAEDLCQLFHRNHGLACLILRTSRFFPEVDDNRTARQSFVDDNLKTNEFLHRRVDIGDVVDAHLQALERAGNLGFGRYVISATTPFEQGDMAALRRDAAQLIGDRVRGSADFYRQQGWQMPGGLDRVYVNDQARRDLGWSPRFGFAEILDRYRQGLSWRSDLAQSVGTKGYHAQVFEDGPFPVE